MLATNPTHNSNNLAINGMNPINNSHYQVPLMPVPMPMPNLFPPQMAPSATAPPPSVAFTPEQAQALSAVIPADVRSDPVALQRHLELLQQLVQLKVPAEQWPQVIEALRVSNAASAQGMQAQMPQAHIPPQQIISQAPPAYGLQAQRGRSRSPTNRRQSPVYGAYQGNGAYRQRSPRGNTSSNQADIMPNNSPKWIEHDPSLRPDHIKVLSRTLFVGGTQANESELRSIFGAFGTVQTCIPNPDKRHAFIKYTNRAGAVTAREALANISDETLLERIRSVRWGVGFGPRDCNDYKTGISVIPISKLTDADRKWVLSAPYGGSGGQPIVSGMVIEEPDIEIGAGVSSKGEHVELHFTTDNY